MKSQSHSAKASRDKKILSKLPDTPGVYFFRSKSGSTLYIGKATSLRDRVRSYFSQDIATTRGPLIVKMLEEFHDVHFQQTDSVLEALILEANLIKKYQPPYNTAQKDNKSFNYVVVTKEAWPRVLLMRGRDLEHDTNPRIGTNDTNKDIGMAVAKQFGPFPNAGVLKQALEMVRKIFPYRDNKCVPCEEQHTNIANLIEFTNKEKRMKNGFHVEHGMTEPFPRSSVSILHSSVLCKPCFNRQIGLCPGVCTGEITKEEYKETIKNIVEFFKGNKRKVIKNLEEQMKTYAKAREFEKAGEIKRQIFALNHIHDIALIKSDLTKDYGLMTNDFRVEAYDVAHFAGKNVVGVMTVVENGVAQKSEYRKFKIKDSPGVNDTKALREILRRRLNHDEWRLPNLIVVDGAVAQKNAAEAVLLEYDYKIPVVAVTKNEFHKPKNILGDRIYLKYESEILLANNEAHRYGIAYHKKLREKLK